MSSSNKQVSNLAGITGALGVSIDAIMPVGVETVDNAANKPSANTIGASGFSESSTR